MPKNFSFCYTFERMDTCKITQIERTGGGGGGGVFLFLNYIYPVLNDCKCEDSNYGAFVV